MIKSLVKRYTKHSLTELNGPITVVSGKRRRLTFIESSNDLNSMIDIGKIADLVLLLVDGNFGLEMETMEFLEILKTHGFPRVFTIATHLDLFTSPKTLRASKKRLKQRIWTEVYQGSKVFYLSGIINGRYPDREILNLTRFLSTMKFRPLKWRNEHSYLLADRIIDITHPEKIESNPKIDRTITLYGYLRGTSLPSNNARIHIPGIGDLNVKEVEQLPDPCPTPFSIKQQEERERLASESAEKNNGIKIPTRRKRLDEKMKTIYAPMSDVGGILVDKDAVYVEMGQRSFIPGEEKGQGEKMVTSLQSAKNTLTDSLLKGPGIKLFDGADDLNEVEEQSEEESNDEDQNNTGRKSMRNAHFLGKALKDEDYNDDELNDEEDDENDDVDYDEIDINYKDVLKDDDSNINSKSNRKNVKYAYSSDSELGDFEDEPRNSWTQSGNFKRRKVWDIGKLLYLNNLSPEEVIKRWRNEDNEDSDSEEDIEKDDDDEEDEDFFKKKDSETFDNNEDGKKNDLLLDCVSSFYDEKELEEKWNNEEDFVGISNRFLGAPKMKSKDNKDDEDDDEEVFGDFEDLEAGEDDDENENEDNSEDEDSNEDSNENDDE